MQAHSSQLIAHRKARISSLGLTANSYQLSALGQSVKKVKGSSEASENIADRGLRIVIAGGGTGGHLFPGIAIAQEFQDRDATTEIIFVSTGNRLEKAVLAKTGFELRTITAAGGITTDAEIRALEEMGMNAALGMSIYRKTFPELFAKGQKS